MFKRKVLPEYRIVRNMVTGAYRIERRGWVLWFYWGRWLRMPTEFKSTASLADIHAQIAVWKHMDASMIAQWQLVDEAVVQPGRNIDLKERE